MMAFTNAGISLENIPSANHVEWQPVEPGLTKLKQSWWAILWSAIFLIAGILMFVIPEWQKWEIVLGILAGLVLLGGIHFFAMMKSVKYKAFAIREHDIYYRTGWIIRSAKVVPFNRVQHCSVSAGVLGRKYGISNIRLFTSGGSAADILIPGLKPQVAEDLRDWILQKIHQDEGEY